MISSCLHICLFSCGQATLKRLCPSVRPSVCLSVMIEMKSGKSSILDTFCVCLCVGGGDYGLDGDWTPLPTRPQRHCDPASLVSHFAPISIRLITLSVWPDPRSNGGALKYKTVHSAS